MKEPDINLPKILSSYSQSDYSVQQKVRFIFYIMIAAIIGIVFLAISSVLIQLKSSLYTGLYFQVLIPMIFLLFLFVTCLIILIKGKYSIASHLFVILSMISIWYIMWDDGENFISRIDTLVLLIALISLIPLFTTKYKSVILFYSILNLIVLAIFVYNSKSIGLITIEVAYNIFIDTSIAIIFAGIVGYNIFRINKQSIEKVESDHIKRKEAELHLSESELKYRTIFENAQIGIYQTTPEGAILQANPALIRMLGFKNFEELSKRNTKDESVYVNSTRATFIDLIEKQGYVRDFESEWKKKSEQSIQVSINARTVRDINGRTLFYEGFVEDITQRKKAMLLLKQSELFREKVFNSSKIPIVVMESETLRYIDLNDAVIQIYGFSSREEIVGKTLFDVSAQKQYDGILSSEKALHYINTALEKGSVTFEWLYQRSDGKLWDAEVHLLAFESNNKTLLQFSLIDITDRKKTEKELRESQQLFKVLAQVSPVGIFRTKPDGYTTYVNPKWTELSGLSFEEALGDGWLKAVHPEDREKLQLNWKSDASKSNRSTAEYRFLRTSGSMVWVLGNAEPEVMDNKIIGYIGTITDITEKKKIEQELEKYRKHLEFLVQERTDELATANEELTSTNEELLKQREELENVLINLQTAQKQLVQAEKMASLGVLAAGIAHEINNPLNFIKGGLFGLETYINDNLKDHLEEISPLLDGINEGIFRAANIVTSLNHYNRKNDETRMECDMHSIIDNCLVIVQNQTKNRIEIEKNYTDKVHNLIANDGKLHQAILNILTNSIHAIENNGVISINTKIRKNNLLIEIKDTGHGIDPAILSKIVDPFFTTKEPGKGTGLGLSITNNIIQEHNGSIDFDSKVNLGTTVSIILPLKQSE